MTTEAQQPRRRRRRFGCLLRVAVALLVVTGIVVAIGEIFDQGPNAKQPAHGFDAGPLDAYQRGTVSYDEAHHVFIVRLPDGTLLALYDRSSRQQELGGGCRVTYDEKAALNNLPQIAGMTGAFVESCEGLRTVWRVDGALASGAGYGALDRFDTKTTSTGDLFVSDSRSCTRSVGVAGVPPYRAQRCSGSG
ncbi:MAG TPA: hypothetical protein VEZ14_00630 [Dehalococcoidia bacterium]|nr:hypothetical protein [Dehalococcoidia bacterium]